MDITFFIDSARIGETRQWADALTALGHEAGVAPLADGAETTHEYAWDDICGFDMARQPHNAEQHRTRARRVAGHVENCLEQKRPDAAVVWGDATTAQRAAAAACKRLGVPVVYSELGWFRRPAQAPADRTLLFDCVGLKQRPNELSREWWDKRLTAEQEARLDEYVDWWKGAKSSKHGQRDQALPAQAHESGDNHTLLVLLQVDPDSALHFAEGVTTQAGVMEHVRAAAGAHWHILVKEHPASIRSAEPSSGEVWLRDSNLHDCLGIADCVVTANSNAGLEALLHEKPVICLADAPYGRLGFTFDVRNKDVLERKLAQAQFLKPPTLESRFLRSFLYYVIFEYCFSLDEVDALGAKLEHRIPRDGQHARSK